MTFGLLLWKLPHAQDCAAYPDYVNIVQSRGTYRLAALWRALTTRKPL